MTNDKDIGKMIAAHIEYSDAVRRFADTADWVRVRDRIKHLEDELQWANTVITHLREMADEAGYLCPAEANCPWCGNE